jgi:integrase
MSIITPAYCETKVSKRDRKADNGRDAVTGLMIDRTPNGTFFYFRFINRATGKRDQVPLGAYHAETNSLYAVRERAMKLRSRVARGENISHTIRNEEAAKTVDGLTVGQLIDLRIEFMKSPNPKRLADGKVRPRLETWSNVAGHLNRFIRPDLGRMLAKDVTSHDLAAIQNRLADNYVSNARHFRRAATSMFRWAAERRYIPRSPCHDLPRLAGEASRERHLDENEIRALWHGLDRADMPWNRNTRLAIKFQLATMLRSAELMALHTSEIVDLDGKHPYVKIPLERVKKRRVIEQPLSPLAVEIIKEALADRKHGFVFESPRNPDKPLYRKAAANALTGTRHTDGRVKSHGICALLGLNPLTPHDLRRTAATLAGNQRFPLKKIELCLDHQKQTNGLIYDRSERREEKRELLNAVGDELLRIISDEPEARLAA